VSQGRRADAGDAETRILLMPRDQVAD